SGGGWTRPGFVNSIQFVNGTLAPDALLALGGPTPAGLPPGNGVLRISSISQNATLLSLNWTGPTGQFQLQKATNLSQPLWQDVGSSTTNRSGSLPITDLRAYYRLRQFRP